MSIILDTRIPTFYNSVKNIKYLIINHIYKLIRVQKKSKLTNMNLSSIWIRFHASSPPPAHAAPTLNFFWAINTSEIHDVFWYSWCLNNYTFSGGQK